MKEVCKQRGITHWVVDGQNRADNQIADLEDLAVKKSLPQKYFLPPYIAAKESLDKW